MKKTKELFKKAVTYIKKIMNDNGEYSLVNSLILIFCLSCWLVVFQMTTQGFNFLQLYGPILLFNIVPIFLIMCLFYFVVGKISISYIISNTLMAVLLIINHYKIKFRDEPLTATDFSLGTEANNIIQNYDIKIDAAIIFVILFCSVSFWFVAKNIKNKRPKLLTSLIGIIVCCTLGVTANFTIYKKTNIYAGLLSNLGIFHESKLVSSKGLVYSLLNSSKTMKYQAPEGYTKESAKEILNRYPKPVPTENTPNVIAVMSEAFEDIQDWGNVRFTNENPYSYFNYLKSIGAYGEILVPGFGGATAVSEFEFLTGNNTSAISSSLPTAYKTLITQDTYSIVRRFKELGYTADAMHPGYPWFYNRQNVYKRMGFDSFTSKEDLEGEIPSINTYAMDTVSAEMIINAYSKHLEENPDKGYFNFLVTIQNHGPYNDNKLVYEKEYISKDAGLTDEEYYVINNYLGGIKDNNMFMKTIYEYINTLSQPTVFIIFGDHLPSLDSENQLFGKLGLDIESNTYEAFENKFKTPYVIVGNRAYLRHNRPSIRGNQGTVSANYLPIKLFQYMNMELDPFLAFSKEMMEYAPIISTKHIGTSAGFDEQLPEEFNKTLNEFKQLQYYNIKDYAIDLEGENQ